MSEQSRPSRRPRPPERIRPSADADHPWRGPERRTAPAAVVAVLVVLVVVGLFVAITVI